MGLRARLTRRPRPGTAIAIREGSDVARFDPEVAQLQSAAYAVQEAFADAQLALEDAGWAKITTDAGSALSRAGLRSATAVARAMAATNPLIGRGLILRCAYVWGSGVQITARAVGADTGQDVNTVVQAFLDDEGNAAAWTGEGAREENERALGTDGQVFAVLFTAPKTGAVAVRTLPWDEIEDVITNPEDRAEPWYYERKYTASQIGADGLSMVRVERHELHPALGYRPAQRVRAVVHNNVTMLVRWDAPVLHVAVNRAKDSKWGVGDVYTALPWARAYRDFLADWAQLVKALSRFAWRRSAADKGKGAAAARKIRDAAAAAEAAARAATTGRGTGTGTESAAGALVETDGALEAIPKTGATIDSESGRPLAAMVAAGLNVPVTWLLADPGVTGARATAVTLDEPTKLILAMRRSRWISADRRILAYVIAEAVRAPGGSLRGTIVRDEFGREKVVLAQDTDAGVEIVFPPLEKVDPLARLQALQAAADLGVPSQEIVRLALEAIGVDDVDQVMEELTDEDGRFVDPALAAAAAAIGAYNAGGSASRGLAGQRALPPAPAGSDQS